MNISRSASSGKVPIVTRPAILDQPAVVVDTARNTYAGPSPHKTLPEEISTDLPSWSRR